MKDRRGVGLDGNAVAMLQKVKIERGQDRHSRCRGRLMPANFCAIGIGAHVVGVVNDHRCQPEHTLLDSF